MSNGSRPAAARALPAACARKGGSMRLATKAAAAPPANAAKPRMLKRCPELLMGWAAPMLVIRRVRGKQRLLRPVPGALSMENRCNPARPAGVARGEGERGHA